MLTPQFVPVVGGSAVSLSDLTPVGEGVDTEGAITVQTLNAYGVTVDSYMWIDWSADDDIVGWCNGNFEVVEGITFAPGLGLWVTGTGSDAGIQSAGKVGTSDVVVQLRSGATATGNPFPTSISLQDIVPQGDNVNTEGGITIQTLDAFGRTVDSYMWIDWSADDDIVGWCDGNFEVVEGVSFAAGKGLWVTGTSNSGEYLRFPAPEL